MHFILLVVLALTLLPLAFPNNISTFVFTSGQHRPNIVTGVKNYNSSSP